MRWLITVNTMDPRNIVIYPDSKVHGANMGPICGRQDPGEPHVGPMNFAIWDSNRSWDLHVCFIFRLVNVEWVLVKARTMVAGWQVKSILGLPHYKSYIFIITYLNYLKYISFQNLPDKDVITANLHVLKTGVETKHTLPIIRNLQTISRMKLSTESDNKHTWCIGIRIHARLLSIE